MADANSTEAAQAATDSLVERTLTAMRNLDAGQRDTLLDAFAASDDFGWLRAPETEAKPKAEISVSIRFLIGKPIIVKHHPLRLSSLVSDLEAQVAKAHGGNAKLVLCAPAGAIRSTWCTSPDGRHTVRRAAIQPAAAILQSSDTIQDSGLKDGDEVLAVVQRKPISVLVRYQNTQKAMDSDGDGWIFYTCTTKIAAQPMSEEAWVETESMDWRGVPMVSQKRDAAALAYIRSVLADEKPRWSCDDEDGYLEAVPFGYVVQEKKDKLADLLLLLSQATTVKYKETTSRATTYEYVLSAFVDEHCVNLEIKVDSYMAVAFGLDESARMLRRSGACCVSF